ncbi:Negative regulator of phenolic acid metabolism PadR [Pediococcus damnosus]|uniref:Negative regulator of phenolic acid metabolism PadR n=1 Tax=Pediococcus damnosus TaxID=51663 RepID=A0A0R2HI17_9LACO|nr:PadR family transcriptional regulator [Pediococcus damnosus]AMV61164.1 Negative regulator of phenolic acid metabolism PadR [Pediococcus damnosus]AMV61788.1 Negative regulator of phenolic acid metabolism PadR [Pediococcus damnosus]AMV65523.1 Negative regulator of phenolic acid metabolism PadR [Pediococcus damnosus]AMV66337.1 Negative regulator of phenolic acid metabolism PadR [Pediococcus damnosus]KRN52251.1 regulator of phenolic acid metabolism PadR [Pediococcus damnosus]
MAQKNRLKYVLLGLLKTKKQTGYDLAKSFDSDIGEFWNANHSQIYPLLKRMEEDKLIGHEDVTVGQKLQKKQYFITNKGQKIFYAWLKSPSDLDNTHDEFILKLFFIDDAQSPLLKPMIITQQKYHEEKLQQLNTQFKQKFSTQKKIDQNFGHSLVLRHAIDREQGYSNWLTEMLKLI